MQYNYNGINNGTFDLIDASQLKFTSSQLKKDCYKIIWTKGDDCTIGLDGYRILLKKNHLLFATPLNSLDFEIENKDIVIYAFNREFYCIRDHDSEVSCNGFLFLGSSTPLIVELSEKEQKSFKLLYEFFLEEFDMVDHIQGEMLLVLLKRLLIKSVRIARKILPKEDMPQPKLDVIRKFNLLIEMHYRERHKVGEYAELMNMSSKSISNLFARYYNKTPLKVINERIVLEGKRLLTFSDKNISEISYLLGFEEASHFSKFFKKNVGFSPKHYKSQHLDS